MKEQYNDSSPTPRLAGTARQWKLLLYLSQSNTRIHKHKINNQKWHVQNKNINKK